MPRSRPTPRRRAIEERRKDWSFSASVYTYLVPDSRDYVQPTITADRGWLHLEARYNYEDLDTGSAWVGYNFSGGEKLAWEFTPMLGGVFGDTTGIAPGYKGSLSWWKLELYSEGEYVVRHRRFVRQLLLQLVGADARPGGLVPVRPGDPAHSGSTRPTATSSAGCSLGFSYKKVELHHLRVQSGREPADRRSCAWE